MSTFISVHMILDLRTLKLMLIFLWFFKVFKVFEALIILCCLKTYCNISDLFVYLRLGLLKVIYSSHSQPNNLHIGGRANPVLTRVEIRIWRLSGHKFPVLWYHPQAPPWLGPREKEIFYNIVDLQFRKTLPFWKIP